MQSAVPGLATARVYDAGGHRRAARGPRCTGLLEPVRGNRARPFLKAFRWMRHVLLHAGWRIVQRIAIRRDRPDS